MNKANDLIMLSAVLFLLILNPLFSILSDKFAIPIALAAVAALYAMKPLVNRNESRWKNARLEYFFRQLEHPGKFDMYTGIITVLAGRYIAQLSGFSNREIFTVIFFSYYILSCIFKRLRYKEKVNQA